MLNVLDEFTHECPAIRIARKLRAIDVIDILSDLSSYEVFQVTSGPTMGLSSWPRRCSNGSRLLVLKPPTSSGAVRGRTAISRASMPGCVTSSSTAKSSIHSVRRDRDRRAGDATTIRSGPTHHSITDHQQPRCSCPRSPRGRLRYVDQLRRHAGARPTLN